MKIPSPRESLTHFWHQFCFLFAVALSFVGAGIIIHGMMKCYAWINHKEIPAWIEWFCYTCDLVLGLSFVIFCFVLHFTDLGSTLKTMWEEGQKKSEIERLANENKQAIIASHSRIPDKEFQIAGEASEE